MKKHLLVIAVAMGIGMAPTVKADLVIAPAVAGSAIMFGAGALFAKLVSNPEPHWSFRDGCKVATVKAEGGGYSYASYDHCKSLPRVYGGIEWKPAASPAA